jgi:hypothetical protein
MKIKKNVQTKSEPNSVKSNKAVEAGLNYIKSAIDVLGAEAKNNQKLKDAIANLSVVYFDLK